jgi:hypothetical protein
MSYDDDMGWDEDIGYDFVDPSPSSEDVVPAPPPPRKDSFETQLILGTGKAKAGNIPPIVEGSEEGIVRSIPVPGWSKYQESPPEPPPEKPSSGYFRINPNATWWDWLSAPLEFGVNTAGTIASGGWVSPDLQLGTGDVLQYVDSSGKVHSDISQYGAGKSADNPQSPGLQLDFGYGPVTGATLSLDQKGLSYHTPFDPGGTVDKATELVSEGVKSVTDFYGTHVDPHIPRLATGGLASLPQISQSGLYRAMGRG